MTTATKSGGGVLKLLGVIVLVVAAGLFFQNNRPGQFSNKDDKRVVILSAIWHPSPRSQGVLVRTWVDGVAQDQQTSTIAPVWWTVMVDKGKRVEIRARVNDAADIFIGCSIAINGNEIVNEHISKGKMGDEVVCWAVT